MRKIVALLAGLMLVAFSQLTQASTLNLPKDAEPSAGGWTSGNIEWVSNVLISQDGVGGRLVGNYFYANDQNKIMIFDVSDPLNPVMTDYELLPQEWELSREDLDTNGEILVMPNLGELYIFDVEDKTNIQLLATAPGGQHTQSCILDCTYAYGSDGAIHDLRNPAKPKLLDMGWGEKLPTRGGHDVEEVAPGKVLTATQPIMLLDVRKDPTKPKLLASGANLDGRFIHSGRWAQNGKDDFLVMGGEKNLTPTCAEDPSRGAIMTWDASQWEKTGQFKMIDEYYAKNGTYTDGNPPANPGIGGCSSHWLEPHPKFNDGGIVAAAFFGHGVRLFDISSKGQIKEHGYFIPYGSEAGAVYWVTPEIMYVLDYNRGIDILRYTGKG
jgi:hypothetical protein